MYMEFIETVGYLLLFVDLQQDFYNERNKIFIQKLNLKLNNRLD